MGEWMEWVGGWMEGWVDGRMGGWMDGCTFICMLRNEI